ncbi:MAG: hypothetical protein JNK29_18350 [Anaerolineales bacterium]|nr:hypothetical protein [Anaerolineales bacterium]
MFDLFTPADLRILMGLTFFGLGLIAVGAGMVILIFGPYTKEAKILAGQSARISQKALVDNITGVAQSATELVNAVNALIRTSSGNAIVLIVVGALFEASAYRLLVIGA